MNKSVLSKLSKIESNVELSDVKVDLALADDLKQSMVFLQKAADAVNASIKGYEDAYKKMQTESKGANSILDTQTKLINKVEAMAKDLGVNPTSIPNYNDVNKSWETLSAVIDSVKQF